MGMGKVKKKLYHFTYDKPKINKKALQFKKSVDEVKKILGNSKQKKERD